MKREKGCGLINPLEVTSTGAGGACDNWGEVQQQWLPPFFKKYFFIEG